MCLNFRCAGIETTQVEGYVKHSKYEPGDDVGCGKFAGAWTAILINGAWHVAHIRWCTKEGGGVNHAEFYFLTNPEEFIYTHFATEPKWQLLARPVSLQEFTQMAYLEPHFFECQLRLKSHRGCVVSAPEGVTRIELGIPPNAVYEFKCHLYICTERNIQLSIYKGEELKRLVFMDVHEGTLNCTVEFPVSGKFKLELYCANKAVSDTYFRVCKYAINAEKAKPNARYCPANSRPQWGPSHDMAAVGLKPITHKRGMVHVEKGELEMRFGAEKDIEVLPKVHSSSRTADDMDSFVIYWIEDKKVVLVVKLPEAGDYALNLYAKERGENEGGNLPKVCSYLISTDRPAMDASPFVLSGNGQLGATNNFYALRMKAVSQPSPYVVDPKNGQMDFLFDTPVPCDLLVQLFLCKDKIERVMEGFAFIDKRADKATVMARFPEKGNYKLTIYGKKKNKDGSYPVAFVYFIIVSEPIGDCCQFPKAYNSWSDDCELAEPDFRNPLSVDKTISFAVKVPEAENVAVIHPTNGWTFLTKDKDQMWKGNVSTGSEAGKVIQLAARFGDGSGSHDILLDFKVRNI